MPAVMIGLMVGGMVLDAYGKKKAGDQSQAIGNYNAGVYEGMATDAERQGKVDESRFRQQVKGLIGSQRAGFAGQGVDVGSGSALDVQADAAFLGELDAQQIRTNAQRDAAGLNKKAQSARMGGELDASRGNYGAASTILGGTGSLLQARYGWGTK